ncbi:MAG TPA: response regulator [Thermoanaerobaculia bacterium]|jgi:DNA-binding response OmpR family regulator
MLRVFRKKGRVLLLDDDVSIQRLVGMLLRRHGLRVDVVGKGSDAIDAIGKEQYDALLLDLMMPHEGGMTVIRHLRDVGSPMLSRVIVLTATPGSVLKTIEKDVAAIVHKPFEADDLLATIDRVMSDPQPSA